MPNWCNNRLIISAKDDDELASVKALLLNDKGELDFGLVTPMPESVLTHSSNASPPDWYVWSLNNWGTKWNACETVMPSPDTIIFQTAWNQPDEWFYSLLSKLDNMGSTVVISLEYGEPGCDFGGIITRESTGGFTCDEFGQVELAEFLANIEQTHVERATKAIKDRVDPGAFDDILKLAKFPASELAVIIGDRHGIFVEVNPKTTAIDIALDDECKATLPARASILDVITWGLRFDSPITDLYCSVLTKLHHEINGVNDNHPDTSDK